MTCSHFIERFSDYVDGEGSTDFVERAEAHLDTCAECRRYVDVFERGRELLRSFPEVEVSDDFHPRLRHRIYHIEDGPSLAPGPNGSATSAVTALGMAVLLVLAAWSPVMLTDEPEVEMAPVVVTRPASRSLGIRPARPDLLDRAATFADDEDLWRRANALLFRYSPLAERAGQPRFTRAGLD